MTITSDMENLQNALFFDNIPESWNKRAYPSMNGLTIWYSDLLQRIKELESWVSDFNMPVCIWLAGFFNPQSFLTAIMQSMARKVYYNISNYLSFVTWIAEISICVQWNLSIKDSYIYKGQLLFLPNDSSLYNLISV